MPIFVDRVAELPRLLELLAHHPEGLPIADLATHVGRSPDAVRQVLLTYFAADPTDRAPDLNWRPVPIEFVSGFDEDEDADELDDPHTAAVVRLVEEAPGRQLGVAYVPVAELARMYRIGRDRLDLEPDNEILRSAVDHLRDGLLPGVMPRRPDRMAPHEFERARRERRKVRISYARAWHPGVLERVVEPYRLVRTRRGWELDAGPVAVDGQLRTYLLDRVQSYEVLPDPYEPPSGVADLLRRQRTPTLVDIEVPHAARWAVEKQAESVVVADEDETFVRLRANLLEPVRHRIGLIMIDAGPNARVRQPAELADAGRDLARTLLQHYLRQGDGENPAHVK